MESQILERIRQLEADIERHRMDIVLERMVPCIHPRHKLLRDHFIARRAEQIERKAAQLTELHLDDEDLMDLIEQPLEVDDAVAKIERRAAELRQKHHRMTVDPVVAETPTDLLTFLPEVESLFTSAERLGALVDLRPHHGSYMGVLRLDHKNKPHTTMPDISYPDFIGSIVNTFKFPIADKLREFTAYQQYVGPLRDYLRDFYRRTNPLQGKLLDQTMSSEEDRVREGWDRGAIPRWESDRRKENPSAIDLAIAECQIEALIDTLLSAVLVKTKATTMRQATRHAEELLREQELDEKSFRESVAASSSRSKEQLLKSNNAVATAEDYDVSKKADDANSDVNDDELIKRTEHNTLGDVPLDDDGKPVRLYLVKLHGLLHLFSCEICGGEVYRGPKAYHDHFFQERHTEGLQILGIRNSPIYDGISTISEALQMRDAVGENRILKRIREDEELQENEDVGGKVFTKRDMENLRNAQMNQAMVADSLPTQQRRMFV